MSSRPRRGSKGRCDSIDRASAICYEASGRGPQPLEVAVRPLVVRSWHGLWWWLWHLW